MVERIQRGSETHYLSYISSPEGLVAITQRGAHCCHSLMQGGKFIHGFISASLGSFSSSAMSKLDINSVGLKLAVSSGVGGTSSALTGGSFANGAITGAFTTIFNHMQHDGDDTPEKTDYDKYKTSGKRITSGRADALNFLINASKQSGVEVSMYLLEDGSYFVNPWEGNTSVTNTSPVDYSDGVQNPKDPKSGLLIKAQYHYGPSVYDVPSVTSQNDKNYSYKYCIPVYHIGKANTYAYPRHIFGSDSYSNHNYTTIPTTDFINLRGKTISFEFNNNQ